MLKLKSKLLPYTAQVKKFIIEVIISIQLHKMYDNARINETIVRASVIDPSKVLQYLKFESHFLVLHIFFFFTMDYEIVLRGLYCKSF